METVALALTQWLCYTSSINEARAVVQESEFDNELHLAGWYEKNLVPLGADPIKPLTDAEFDDVFDEYLDEVQKECAHEGLGEPYCAHCGASLTGAYKAAQDDKNDRGIDWTR